MIFRGFIEHMINSFHFTLKLYKKNFKKSFITSIHFLIRICFQKVNIFVIKSKN